MNINTQMGSGLVILILLSCRKVNFVKLINGVLINFFKKVSPPFEDFRRRGGRENGLLRFYSFSFPAGVV